MYSAPWAVAGFVFAVISPNSRPWNAAALRALGMQMEKPKYTARIENIYFLERVGETLRWATQDIADEQLPANIKHLLARLDRLEARAQVRRRRSGDEPSPRVKGPPRT
jgi:hypothetical protein